MSKSKLSTTNRGSGIKPLAPTSEAINQAMACVRNSPEGADYLLTSFNKQMTLLGMTENAKGMQQQLVEYREYVHLKCAANGQPWSGEFVESDFKNWQRNMADKAAQNVAEKIQGPVNMDFAINEDSGYKRVFLNEGQKLTGETARQLDKLVNTFFAENDIVNKGSVLYEATEDGEIKHEGGEPSKADPEKVDNLMSTELKDYFVDHGVEADVRSRSISESKQQAQKAAAEKAKVEIPAQKGEGEAPTAAPAA